MKVIVTYRNFHDIERIEIMPEVFSISKNESSEEALRRIWEDYYNNVLAENLNGEIDDPLDEENCWCEEDMALITYIDGDTKEFYVIDVEDYTDWR